MDYEEFLSTLDHERSKTAQFYFADLHVHTHDSEDYTTTAEDISPEDLETLLTESEKQWKKSGTPIPNEEYIENIEKSEPRLNIVAITDHGVCDLACKLSQMDISECLILPGIEIKARITQLSKSDSIVSKASETSSEILLKLKKEKRIKQKRINELTVERDRYIASIKKLGPSGAEVVADNLEKTQIELKAVKSELKEIENEEIQIKNKTLNADTAARTLKEFAQIIECAEPIELKRILPTVIKGVEIIEDPKTGEGYLEVFLWEEAQEAIDIKLFKNNKKDEPVVNNRFVQVSKLAPRVGLEPTT